MAKRKKTIHVGVASVQDIKSEVLAAWKVAERGEGPQGPIAHLYFVDAATLLKTLTPRRFELLRALRRRGPLPAGIIISGGGAGIGSISDIAKGSLKLPARLAEFRLPADTKIRDATWAVAYGLALWGLTGDTSAPKKSFRDFFGKFFQQFLP